MAKHLTLDLIYVRWAQIHQSLDIMVRYMYNIIMYKKK